MMLTQWCHEKLLYPLFDTLASRSISSHYKDYLQAQWRNPATIKCQQFLTLKALLCYAYEKVPYYTQSFKKHKFDPKCISKEEDLLKCPILTKQDINKNRNLLIGKGVKRESLIESQSGGSTGEPIKFYVDNTTLDAHKAIGMRFYSMMDLPLGSRAVRMWGQPRIVDSSTTIKGKIYEWMNNRMFFDGFDLSEKKMGEYVKKIKKFKPKLLIGYVQCIDLLARYIIKNRISGIRPQAVFTTASVLYPEIRQRMGVVFKCKVFNEYGSCELGAVAHECNAHQGMHIDSEIVYLEFLKDGKLANPGEEAEIYATTLCNWAMPLIRYKVGDIGSYTDEPCACGRGSRRITSLLGRTFGVFTAIDGTKVHGYYFTNRVFMKIPNVKQFQMIQDDLEHYTIKIVRNPGFNSKDIEFIETKIKEKLGEVDLEYEFLEKIDPEGSGKYLYTKSYVEEGY